MQDEPYHYKSQDQDTQQEAATTEAPRTRMEEITRIEAMNVEPLRNNVHTSRLKREEANGNVLMAEEEIAKIEAKQRELAKTHRNWSRWRDYQRTRRDVFDRRMRLDLEELRTIEDFDGEQE
jgi:hypothetical protein